ncbi:hypoxanthine phosphoribosyltransferase [Corallococcus praedator]|uniref:Hypoxanthine phosphoribosyltransferase n=1 Tax=Corallococcus praedator TaxID=2316724 RepID=A0ABX9QA93_9BACT|nr:MULTISPECIES: hypoxanthine phosphoribosyltransferase [Corallococcus]RKH19361.1 hypoxanthine phosphoribosyltransferase [Corallococcus sp. CA047B]RKH20042.1 hypoxanthine phosphoribosyltransferase [Corallococcus sp. CA031C]RKH97947.1 hypoxanthine phosphoribosyltransferase [Corallococcus praedator]
MTFHEKDVDVLISEEAVQARVKELGAAITRDYQGKELTLICVLKGSAYFAIDLSRAIDLPLTLEFLGVSSYHGGTESTGEVRITTDVSKPMAGKHLLIIEDIIDTGLTMTFLLENLQARHPASLKLCSLLEKPARARTKVNIDYKGFVIEDKFVVGYGLDYGEKYRNLPFVGVWKNA